MKAQEHTRTVEVHDRAGDVVGTKEVVLYAGLLTQAHEEGLARIRTSILQFPTPDNGRTVIIKAEVETGKGLFEAIGDASPDSVDEHLAPHLIRVAETRAKARALRDAVNVGVASYEELDGVSLTAPSRPGPGAPATTRPARPAPNGAATTRPRSSASRSSRDGNGSELMSEAQRRYLFRLLAGQGYQREAAEERLKHLLEVSSLATVTKPQATQLIDQLLQTSDPASRGGGGNGAAARPQR